MGIIEIFVYPASLIAITIVAFRILGTLNRSICENLKAIAALHERVNALAFDYMQRRAATQPQERDTSVDNRDATE